MGGTGKEEKKNRLSMREKRRHFSLPSKTILSGAEWCHPVIPSIQEAEVGGFQVQELHWPQEE